MNQNLLVRNKALPNLPKVQCRRMPIAVDNCRFINKDEKTGTYLFAPSKYIGYQDMTASKYVETYAYMDGRKTEKVLSEWFEMIDESEEDFDFLNRKLLAMFSATGKTINALFRINVLKREEDNELLEKDLVELIYKVFLGLSDESKALIKQKISNKI